MLYMVTTGDPALQQSFVAVSAEVSKRTGRLPCVVPRPQSPLTEKLHALGEIETVAPQDLSRLAPEAWAAWQDVAAGKVGADALRRMAQAGLPREAGVWLQSYLFCVGGPHAAAQVDCVTDVKRAVDLYHELSLDTQHVALFAGDWAWLPAACLYAASHRLPLFLIGEPAAAEELPDVPNSSVLSIIADPSSLEGDRLARLLDRLNVWHGPQHRSWGVITGRTPTTTWEFVVRGSAYDQLGLAGTAQFILVADKIYDEVASDDPDVAILPWKATNTEGMQAMLGETAPVKLLNVMAHGRDDAVTLGGVVLCGYSSEFAGKLDLPSLACLEGPASFVPTCVHSGLCYRQNRVPLRVADLRTEILFLNSCSTLKFGHSAFRSEFNVSLAAAESWAGAVISTPGLVNGRAFLNVLFYHLLRRNWSLGDAVRTVNNVMWNTGLDSPNFLLIGNPAWRPYTAVSEEEGASDRTSIEWGGLTLTVKPGGSHLVIAESRDQEIIRAWQAGNWRITYKGKLTAGAPAYWCASLSPDKKLLQIFFCSVQKMNGTIHIDFGEPGALQQVQSVLRDIENLVKGLELSGQRLQSVQRIYSELRSYTQNVLKIVADAAYDLEAANRLSARLTRLEELQAQVEEAVMAWLLDSATRQFFMHPDEYRPYYVVTKAGRARELAAVWDGLGETCPVCGQPLHHQILTSLLDPTRRRAQTGCINCGILGDQEPGLEAWVEGPSTLGIGGTAQLSINIANRLNRTVRASVGAQVVFATFFHCECKPGPEGWQRIEIPPHGTAQVNFTLQAQPEAVPHQFWLRGFVVGAGQINSPGKQFWIQVSQEQKSQVEVEEDARVGASAE